MSNLHVCMDTCHGIGDFSKFAPSFCQGDTNKCQMRKSWYVSHWVEVS
jgi:hypothetical protein